MSSPPKRVRFASTSSTSSNPCLDDEVSLDVSFEEHQAGTSPLRGSDDEVNRSIVALTDESLSSEKDDSSDRENDDKVSVEPQLCGSDNDEASRVDTSMEANTSAAAELDVDADPNMQFDEETQFCSDMPNPSADKIAVPLENVLMRDGSNVTNLNDSIVDLENSFASSDWKNIESSQGAVPYSNVQAEIPPSHVGPEPQNVDEDSGEDDSDDDYWSTCSLSDSDEEFEAGNEQESNFDPLDDPPLYEGAPISVNDCLLAILALMIRHNLAWSCVKDILMLIFFVCKPVHNNMKASLYLFRKYFSALKCPVIWHYYCSGCYKKLTNSKASCPNANKHPKEKGISYFLEIPLIPQLVALFGQKLFVDSIQHRFKRKKANPNSLNDIYDGQLYKEQVENNGFLSDRFPYNISLLWNTDGIPIFKSTAISLWPVMFTINELPINMRFRKQYVLIGGLWFGKKPEGNIVMTPFQQSLRNLYTGFDVVLPDNTAARARAMLLCGTCDLPAKSSFLGMISHSGAWGCSVCKQKGGSVETKRPPRRRKKARNEERQQIQANEPRKGSVWVYRYQEDIELRNHSEMESYGKEAFKEAKRGMPFKLINVFGVKQPSILTSLFRDVCRGMAVDQMHCLWLGLMKKFLNLWFDKSNSSEPFSLFGKIHIVEELFLQICPPNFVKRGIRSLIENLARLKASELKNFAFYYSLPILYKVMPDVYYDHYHEFISCISILCSSSITPEQLIDCGKRLENWVKKFEELYGVRHMVMCVHLVRHLVFVVTNLGPLWTASCTPFENINGILKRMIHGTRCVEIQLANSAYMVLNFPNAVKTIRNAEVRDWCKSLLYSGTQVKVLEQIDDTMSSVVCYLSNEVDTVIKTLLEDKVGKIITCQIFARLKKEPYLFTSESYTRQKKSKSNFVSFDMDSKKMFGSILMFCRISDCGCKDDCFCKPASYYAVIKLLGVEPHYSKLDSLKDTCFIWQVRSEQPELMLVPVNSLKEIVFCVPSKDFKFLCERVNSVEAE